MAGAQIAQLNEHQVGTNLLISSMESWEFLRIVIRGSLLNIDS